MIVNVSRRHEFIPEWNGNKDSEEPVKVYIQDMSTVEWQECWDTEGVRGTNEMLKAAIISIENLYINEDGEKKHITTADDMLNAPGLLGLYTEVVNAVTEIVQGVASPN